MRCELLSKASIFRALKDKIVKAEINLRNRVDW